MVNGHTSAAPMLPISVVIPARNAEAFLGANLGAVADQLGDFADAELIVVDDKSDDRTACIARASGARVIDADGRGPAAARNLGARCARGDVLVFLDADCTPQPGCLRALAAPFVDPLVVGVRGAYATRQRALLARFTQLEFDEKQERLARSAQVTVVDTACAAYRREAFLSFGGFDEGYPSTSAEDVELSFRVTAAGGRLVFAPGAVVDHRHPEQFRRYLWRKARFGFFRARLYRQYPERLQRDGYTPRLMPVQIVLATLLVATGAGTLVHRRMAPGFLAALCAFAGSSLPLVIRASSSSRALAASVPALVLVRSLAQSIGLLAGSAAVLVSAARVRARSRSHGRRAVDDRAGAAG